MDSFTPKQKDRYRVIDGKASIDLKLKSPHHLFDERDPAPFRDRDLDDDAVRYIVSSYRDVASASDVKISLYFAGMGEFDGNSDIIRKAIHGYFSFEAELKRRELKETFKQGFISLFIGLTFLLACTGFTHAVPNVENPGIVQSMLHEWMFIMGWVAMWKPISIFLYEWWPIRGALCDLRDLSTIEIEIRPIAEASEPNPEPVGNRVSWGSLKTS